jgi:hypothetical protein
MRGNAWQITSIISIILVVVLIVPLVIMGRDYQSRTEETRQAREEQRTTAQRAATLEGEIRTLKTMVGSAETATLAEVQRQHTEIMGRARPGENETTLTYVGTLVDLLADLDAARQAQSDWQAKYEQELSAHTHARDSYDAIVRTERQNVAEARNRLADAEARFGQDVRNFRDQLSVAHTEQNATLAREARTRREMLDRVAQLEGENYDIAAINRDLAVLLEEVRNPNVEHPAGRIISVDQQAGLAHVNLGSADGLMVRTMFSVYHSSITGLSFRTAPVGEEAVYCSVCKRDVARDVSKASVEVTRILGPHRAEVRILQDILTDPIMIGDVVYSPIWKPGQKLRFALTAGMYLPGSGIDSGTEAVKRLIEMNGGIVDCWIDETVPLGEEHLQGAITNLTNFIVVSDKVSRGTMSPEVALAQDELEASARNRLIRTISLDDLLSRMGWRNVTPVAHFDSLEYMPDLMRVVPQNQADVRPSSGVVSPVFTPDNPEARVDARDANPPRVSPGIVAPLFNEAAPPSPSSSGRTSELFRSRSPVGGQN